MNDTKQVAGDHYTTMPIQPWQVIESNNLDFFGGNALKYLMRWKEKGGVEDLDKAIHYIEKLKARAANGEYRKLAKIDDRLFPTAVDAFNRVISTV